MKPVLGFLLALSTILPTIHSTSITHVRRNDDQTVAHYKETGQCFYYIEGDNDEKSMGICKEYCETLPEHTGWGCQAVDTQHIHPYEDDDGNTWVLGKCGCDYRLAEEIFDIVVKGLERLDNVLCAVMLESLTTIADIGSNFVPGVNAAKAVGRAVEAAKTFAENAIGEQDFFDKWIGNSCGMPDWNFDLVDAFVGLVDMPDSLGNSIGCMRKKKKDCKKLEPKPDKPKPKPKPSKDPKPTKSDGEKPTSTKSGEASQTSTDEPAGDSCKINKRDTKNKCLDDNCAGIEPWPKDIQDLGYDHGGTAGGSDENGPGKRSIRGTGFFGLDEHDRNEVVARGTDSGVKKISICGTTYKTEKYPSGGELIGNTVGNKPKEYMDKAIFALKDPKSCGDFDFDRRNNDLFGTVYKDLRNNLGLAAEHVLETQTVTDFFKHLDQTLKKDFPDPFNPDDSVKVGFCDYMKAFWSTDKNVEWPKIDNAVNPAGQFLAHQFPSNIKWRNEFFLLPGGVNGLKGKAWGMGVKEIVSDSSMKAVKNKDYDFLKTKSITQSQFQKEVIKYKDMINLNVYQSNKDVQDILKTQAGRVEKMLENLETEMAKLEFKKHNKKFQRGYESQELAQKWREFIKKEADDMQGKVDKWFDSYASKFTDARKDMEKEAKKLADKKDKKNKKDQEDQKKYEDMIGYLKTAEKKRSSMGKLSNPL